MSVAWHPAWGSYGPRATGSHPNSGLIKPTRRHRGSPDDVFENRLH